MRLPWAKRRTTERRSSGYHDLLLDAALRAAYGATGAKASSTAAAESAAGLLGRAFASATAQPETIITRALSPNCLSMAGRALIRRGEIVFLIRSTVTGVILTPAETVQVFGRDDPKTWEYVLTLTGPSNSRTVRVGSDRVIHWRWGTDPAQPWRGISPLAAAGETSRMLAESTAHLADEASGPRGSLIALGVDPGEPGEDEATSPVAAIQKRIGGLRGAAALMESTRNHGDGLPMASPTQDWKPNRLGANPPDSLVDLSEKSTLAVLAACGVPPELMSGQGQGTAAREAFRRFLHSTVTPLLAAMASEAAHKLATPGLAFDTTGLHAADVSGRARAFQSMVGGGMPIEKAAALSGLLVE